MMWWSRSSGLVSPLSSVRRDSSQRRRVDSVCIARDDRLLPEKGSSLTWMGFRTLEAGSKIVVEGCVCLGDDETEVSTAGGQPRQPTRRAFVSPTARAWPTWRGAACFASTTRAATTSTRFNQVLFERARDDSKIKFVWTCHWFFRLHYEEVQIMTSLPRYLSKALTISLVHQAVLSHTLVYWP